MGPESSREHGSHSIDIRFTICEPALPMAVVLIVAPTMCDPGRAEVCREPGVCTRCAHRD